MNTRDVQSSAAPSPLSGSSSLQGRARSLRPILGALLMVGCGGAVLVQAALGFALRPVSLGDPVQRAESMADPAALGATLTEITNLQRELASTATQGTYLVIDRANNRLWVRGRAGVVHEAIVSTGSGTVLKETRGLQRTWTFDTPEGRFRVLNERKNPVWTKPDWAFLEEGQEVPRRLSERVEKGTLGEWALDLGDGYMIHGTLYERLLGRSLTHGCIRVGRDDLRLVERAVTTGTPVYIF